MKILLPSLKKHYYFNSLSSGQDSKRKENEYEEEQETGHTVHNDEEHWQELLRKCERQKEEYMEA